MVDYKVVLDQARRLHPPNLRILRQWRKTCLHQWSSISAATVSASAPISFAMNGVSSNFGRLDPSQVHQARLVHQRRTEINEEAGKDANHGSARPSIPRYLGSQIWSFLQSQDRCQVSQRRRQQSNFATIRWARPTHDADKLTADEYLCWLNPNDRAFSRTQAWQSSEQHVTNSGSSRSKGISKTIKEK